MADGDGDAAGRACQRSIQKSAKWLRDHASNIGIPLSWVAPWVAFGVALVVGDSSHAPVIVGLALFFLAANLAIFLFILFNPRLWKSELWRLGGAFAATFLAVVAAYAAADYAASHSEVIRNGKPVITQHVVTHKGKPLATRDGLLLDPCYVEPSSPSGQMKPATLSAGDALYVGVGTLTTIGWGDIAARSSCRVMTAGELAIGFPMVSLAIAGLAAGLFKKIFG